MKDYHICTATLKYGPVKSIYQDDPHIYVPFPFTVFNDMDTIQKSYPDLFFSDLPPTLQVLLLRLC